MGSEEEFFISVSVKIDGSPEKRNGRDDFHLGRFSVIEIIVISVSLQSQRQLRLQ